MGKGKPFEFDVRKANTEAVDAKIWEVVKAYDIVMNVNEKDFDATSKNELLRKVKALIYSTCFSVVKKKYDEGLNIEKDRISKAIDTGKENLLRGI